MTVREILTDYAVAPGEFIEEWLEENGYIKKDGLASRMGMTVEQLDALLTGETALSEDIAAKLAPVTGIPARIWLKYEATYRADLARLARGDDEAFKQKVARVTVASIDRLTRAAELLREAEALLAPLEPFEGTTYFEFRLDDIKQLSESMTKDAEYVRSLMNPIYIKNLATGVLGEQIQKMGDDFPNL